MQVFVSFCKFLQGFTSFIFCFVFFVFVFLVYFYNFFINLFYFSTLREKQTTFKTLCMPTMTSDTFKNIHTPSNFQIFKNASLEKLVQVFTSFRKFAQVFASSCKVSLHFFCFVFFVFVFFGLFLNFFY